MGLFGNGNKGARHSPLIKIQWQTLQLGHVQFQAQVGHLAQQPIPLDAQLLDLGVQGIVLPQQLLHAVGDGSMKWQRQGLGQGGSTCPRVIHKHHGAGHQQGLGGLVEHQLLIGIGIGPIDGIVVLLGHLALWVIQLLYILFLILRRTLWCTFHGLNIVAGGHAHAQAHSWSVGV